MFANRKIVQAIACFAAVCSSVTSSTYRAVSSVLQGVTGQCAAETQTPSVTIQMTSGSSVRCANQCRLYPCCLVHQFRGDMGQCQMYNYVPTNYTNSGNCLAFLDEETVPGAVDASRNCSFPFTYNGQLHYRCKVEYTTKCNVWCYLRRRIQATCTPATYGLVAQNKTASINSTPVQLTLSSVNNWLTIFARIDVSWPASALINYTYGFGNNNAATNMWIGLENLYSLTNSQTNGGVTYQLRVEVQATTTRFWYSIEYDFFYVDDAAASYTVHVATSGYGDASDAFNDASYPSNGKPFAYSGGRCTVCGGWWWTNNVSGQCSAMRLFGPVAVCYASSGFGWGAQGDLMTARLMIKAVA